MKVLDIISEKLNRTGSNELVIFDIDDTLLHTTAKINVVNDGRVVRSLTNQEFNNYQLQDGEEFDFGEFRNAEKFEEESIPIGPMLDKLRSDLKSGKNVVMLTARADFDNQKAVWRTFKRHGIDINRDVHLYRAGNLPGSGSPAAKKAIHVSRWLKTGKYNKVTMYDDSEKNLTVFKSLEEKFPNVEFEAHHVSEEGDTRQIEQHLDEKKKRRSRPRWAAFSPGPYGMIDGWLTDEGNKLIKPSKIKPRGVAEGSEQQYLWHGSRNKYNILTPRQAQDTGGAEGSNKNAVYATPNAKVAIAMGLTTAGSDTGMFPNDPQMVLFKGGIRKGEMVYLHKVPKDLFIKHNSREWYSKPDVKEIKPIEIKEVPVDKYLDLIRQATPKDLELRAKYTKKDVEENFADGRNPQDKGDSKRHGVPTKASITTLRKIAKQGGRKGQLAHWMANMKSGRKK